jgi:ubiquinone/menaquinone biosynthesis C-methylase UbiE
MSTLNRIDANKDVQARWSEFRNITTDHPDVRIAERDAVLGLLTPARGETILEAGTGSCYLTFPLARSMGEGSRLITADVNQEGLQELEDRYALLREESSDHAHVEALHYSDDYFDTKKFPSRLDASLDAVVSLATFHHFDTRAPEFNTGHQGKISALKEFKRMLRPGGRLVIADICDNTCTQRYFDAVDSPEHFYPTGHPHNFFGLVEFGHVLESLGYQVLSLEIRETPWVFDSMETAAHYMNRLHNARCSAEESLAIAEREIGFKEVDGCFHMQWKLMYIHSINPYEH